MNRPDETDSMPVLIEKDGSRSGDKHITGKPLVQRGKWGLGELFGGKSDRLHSSMSPQQFRTQKKFRKIILFILALDLILIGTCLTLLMRRL